MTLYSWDWPKWLNRGINYSHKIRNLRHINLKVWIDHCIFSQLDKRKYVYPSKFISSRRSSTIRSRSFASSISLYVCTKLVRWKRISSMIPMESVSWRILISDASSITSSRKSSLWISYRENILINNYTHLCGSATVKSKLI